MELIGHFFYILVLKGGSKSEKVSDLAEETLYYSLNSKKWVKAAGLNESRVHFGCTLMNNQIWVAGGQDKNNNLIGLIEFYEPENNVWTTLKRLKLPRKNLFLSSLEGKLFIIGGDCGNNSILKNVTCYDSKNKK